MVKVNKKKVVKKVKKVVKKVVPKKENKVVNKSRISPLNDRILLKPLTEEEINTTSSGIIIPETVSKEKPEQGIVIAVGEGRWNEDGEMRVPISVKVGDRVVFSRYGYDEVKLDGQEYYILKEENILAVINK